MKLTRPSIAFLLAAFLFAPFLLVSCAKEVEKTVYLEKAEPAITEKVMSIWGVLFEFQPINQADEKLREAAKATAYVRYISGGSATGFFISDDGLFLTNEHVIARSFCNARRCAGIQLIRDFRPGGALEVFEEFEILAQSQEFDFALLKVKLPENRRVPFLKISEKISDEMKLKVLGYPGGGSLHASESKLDYDYGAYADFRSVSVGGNSGSPILNAETLEVVALHMGSSRRDQEIERNGTVHGYGSGPVMKTVLGAIRKLQPNFPQITAVAAASNASKSAQKLLPADSAPPLTSNAFFHQYYDTAEENEMLAKVFADRSANVLATSSLRSFTNSLVAADLYRGRKSAVDASILASWFGEGAVPEPARNFYAGGDRAACVKRLYDDENVGASEYIGRMSSECFSTVTEQDTDLIAYAGTYLEKHRAEIWGKSYEGRTSHLLRAIRHQALLRKEPLSGAQKDTVLAILNKIAEESGTMDTYFQADYLRTMVSERPDLLQTGAYKNLKR